MQHIPECLIIEHACSMGPAADSAGGWIEVGNTGQSQEPLPVQSTRNSCLLDLQ